MLSPTPKPPRNTTPPLDVDRWLRDLGPGGIDLATLQKETIVEPDGVRQAGADVVDGAFAATLRAKAEGDLYFFAKAILGLTRLTTSLHLPVCQWLSKVPPYRKLYLLPRDHLKTSIARALTLHLLIQPRANNMYFQDCWDVGCGRDDCTDLAHRFDGANTRILYAGETDAFSKKQLRWMMAKFDGNRLLRSLWPERVWAGAGAKDPNCKMWNANGFLVPRTVDFPEGSVTAIGVGGAITGQHFDVMVKDDIATLEAANSRALMETTIEWNKASRALMDDPDRSLEFMLGTRWAAGDVWETIQRDDPTVEAMVRSIVEDGQPIFPEMFSLDTIERLRREEGAALFSLIRMNSTKNPEISTFDVDFLREFSVKDDTIVFAEDERDFILNARLNTPTREPEGGVVVSQEFRGQRWNRETYDVLAKRGEYLRMKAG